MRASKPRLGLLLVFLTLVLPFLVGCGAKNEEKDSGTYYTGPMQGKGSNGQSAAAKKLD